MSVWVFSFVRTRKRVRQGQTLEVLTKSIPKLIPWLDARLVEVAVVGVQPLGIVAVAAWADLAVVVLESLGDGVDELAGRVDVAEEDVGYGVAAFLVEGAGVEDGLTIEIGSSVGDGHAPFFQKEGAL